LSCCTTLVFWNISKSVNVVLLRQWQKWACQADIFWYGSKTNFSMSFHSWVIFVVKSSSIGCHRNILMVREHQSLFQKDFKCELRPICLHPIAIFASAWWYGLLVREVIWPRLHLLKFLKNVAVLHIRVWNLSILLSLICFLHLLGFNLKAACLSWAQLFKDW